MASLEVAPSIVIHNGKVYNMLWNRLWAAKTAKYLMEKGIKPEVEIYNNSDMDDLDYHCNITKYNTVAVIDYHI